MRFREKLGRGAEAFAIYCGPKRASKTRVLADVLTEKTTCTGSP